MTVLFRILALVLTVVALMLLGADAVTSLEKGGEMTVRSLDQILTLIDKPMMDGFKAWTQNTLPGPVPHWIFSAIALPGWAITGVLGVILAFIFGRKIEPE